MNEKEYIVTLRDGSSHIVKFAERTKNFLDSDHQFVLFENGIIRKDEIISVIRLDEQEKINYIDDDYAYHNLNKKSWQISHFNQENSNYIGKIIDDVFNGLSKTLDRKLDIDGSGIIISSDDQAIKITNENVSTFEFKEDGTIIIKAPKINFS